MSHTRIYSAPFCHIGQKIPRNIQAAWSKNIKFKHCTVVAAYDPNPSPQPDPAAPDIQDIQFYMWSLESTKPGEQCLNLDQLGELTGQPCGRVRYREREPIPCWSSAQTCWYWSTGELDVPKTNSGGQRYSSAVSVSSDGRRKSQSNQSQSVRATRLSTGVGLKQMMSMMNYCLASVSTCSFHSRSISVNMKPAHSRSPPVSHPSILSRSAPDEQCAYKSLRRGAEAAITLSLTQPRPRAHAAFSFRRY